MDVIAASQVKQNFGDALARAAKGPVAVERHRKVVAALVPPSWLDRAPALDERRAARAAQREVESRRLASHQELGIELLCAPAARQRRLLEAARAEVDRWERDALCSRDYIRRWRQWLELPPTRLVPLMCSAADGWGPAMRQNSPFTAARAAAP